MSKLRYTSVIEVSERVSKLRYTSVIEVSERVSKLSKLTFSWRKQLFQVKSLAL